MKQAILTIFTRTPLHVGAGSSVGAIDQPVIRERHTRFPVIPGSSIKRVLADAWLDELIRNDKGQ
ncbi:MAG TPA: RAMP superfamily CRISPR-associated protein, partial [Kiritimatiellia bacterium]|nr:RAMP superfamily CRISPR-associated protein [Kiritimatiellia bacterium]